MWRAPQGVHAFLRAYYHMKSADWKQNKPFPLAARTATEWAKLPRYYVMDLDKGMAESVAAKCRQPRRSPRASGCPTTSCASTAKSTAGPASRADSRRIASAAAAAPVRELQLFAGRTIDVPSMFISGQERLGRVSARRQPRRDADRACTKFEGVDLVDGAGHWVQQEQAAKVADRLIAFAKATGRSLLKSTFALATWRG